MRDYARERQLVSDTNNISDKNCISGTTFIIIFILSFHEEKHTVKLKRGNI